ncbi:hypothetical protein ITI46_26855 [Streptomyces oryzae]|uniref:Uncharacterized protein n=1 Tax=Streptomyces oryzae TaxID=1434886 RepID=A0ABS3XIW4_9ACTN|nr:hypothetical protein [Streptomyces oryzae]MBO8195241.1 hypothetical protein [Streptomyces oryzae]
MADREAPGRTAQDGPAENDRPPGRDASAAAGVLRAVRARPLPAVRESAGC